MSKSILARNMEYIKRKNHLSQKQLSKCLFVSESMLSNVLREKQPPSLMLLEGLHAAFGYSLDKLMYADVSKEEDEIESERKNYKKYEGLYKIFFSDFSDGSNNDQEIRSGLLVMSANGNVVALLDIDRDTTDEMHKMIERMSINDACAYIMSLKTPKKYMGEMLRIERKIYILLRHTQKSIPVQLSFHDMDDSDNCYYGGLGLMSFVRKSMDAYTSPSACHIGICRGRLKEDASDSDILEHLSGNNAGENDVYQQIYKMLEYHDNVPMSEIDKNTLLSTRLQWFIQSIVNQRISKGTIVTKANDEYWRVFIRGKQKKKEKTL